LIPRRAKPGDFSAVADNDDFLAALGKVEQLIKMAVDVFDGNYSHDNLFRHTAATT